MKSVNNTVSFKEYILKTGTASAYAILMMLLFGFLLFLEFRFVERSVYYEN